MKVGQVRTGGRVHYLVRRYGDSWRTYCHLALLDPIDFGKPVDCVRCILAHEAAMKAFLDLEYSEDD